MSGTSGPSASLPGLLGVVPYSFGADQRLRHLVRGLVSADPGCACVMCRLAAGRAQTHYTCKYCGYTGKPMSRECTCHGHTCEPPGRGDCQHGSHLCPFCLDGASDGPRRLCQMVLSEISRTGPLVDLQRKPLVTHSGREIWLLEPHRTYVDLEDVVLGLHVTRRFANVIDSSVLLHTCLMICLAAAEGHGPLVLQAIAWHDAEEGLLGLEFPQQLKQVVPILKLIGEAWLAHIQQSLGLPTPDTATRAIVKRLDVRSKDLEMIYFDHPRIAHAVGDTGDITPLERDFIDWLRVGGYELQRGLLLGAIYQEPLGPLGTDRWWYQTPTQIEVFALRPWQAWQLEDPQGHVDTVRLSVAGERVVVDLPDPDGCPEWELTPGWRCRPARITQPSEAQP